jgi:hypothetical protein
MPEPLFLGFEAGIALLALVCLRHAWARGSPQLASLVAGMVYGVLLEYMAIMAFHAYAYGHFLVMLFGTVPLCIGVSWGIIIYTAMETSDRYALPWYLRPVLDALLALTIDLSMDAVAIRIGFWKWGTPGPWFGVPLSNFYAWFVVVLGFSLLVRLARLWWLAGRLAGLGDIIVAMVAIPLAVTGFIALLAPALGPLAEGGSGWLSIAALLGAGLVLVGWAARHTRHDQAFDAAVLSVSAFFHVFFLGALFWAGIVSLAPALIAISGCMFVLSAVLHLWPVWSRIVPERVGRQHRR